MTDGISAERTGGRSDRQTTTLVRVTVMPKAGVKDPEGEAIFGGLHSLGYAGVRTVRAGRVFYLDVDAASDEAAVAAVTDMCDRLLANPVIQSYHLETVTDTHHDIVASSSAIDA